MGTRHRAAIGISEETDAIALVVSEETGRISVAVKGKLASDLTRESLNKLLTDLYTRADRPAPHPQGEAGAASRPAGPGGTAPRRPRPRRPTPRTGIGDLPRARRRKPKPRNHLPAEAAAMRANAGPTLRPKKKAESKRREKKAADSVGEEKSA